MILTGRLFGILLAAALVFAPARADWVQTSEGERIEGRVAKLHEGAIQIARPGSQPVKVRLEDLFRVRLLPPAGKSTRLLVDNEGLHEKEQERSGRIKLRKGFHNFHLIYWQHAGPARLAVEYEGPDIERTAIPANQLFRVPSGKREEKSSEGLDDEGFRLPDTPGTTSNNVAYRLVEWDHAHQVSSLRDLRTILLTRYGNTRTLTIPGKRQPQNFGLVYTGYVKVPKDGEYTFYLKSQNASQLYIGKLPRTVAPMVRKPAKTDWIIETVGNGRLTGSLKAWDDAGALSEINITNVKYQIRHAPGSLRSLFRVSALEGDDKVDRAAEPHDADSVYAKSSGGPIQRVAGKVLGIRDDALRFVYAGQERTIQLERVVGIVLGPDGIDRDAGDGFHFVVDLIGRHRLPIQWSGFGKNARLKLETMWGHPLEIRRIHVDTLTAVNGRLNYLSDLEPLRVEQVPFFNRVIPYRVDRAPQGQPLKTANKAYEKGLLVHSRTVLEYRLDGKFTRFRCDVGFQHPEGKLGNAVVRVRADGDVLFENPAMTGDAPAEALDLDLTGRERLTLEVDFGENLDVADRVIWGNARLLRPPQSTQTAATSGGE